MNNKESTYYLLKNFWAFIPKRRKIQLIGLILLTIIVSLAEIISIGAVLPFLGALTAPDRILEMQFLQPIFNQLNIYEPSELLFPMTFIFISAAILSGIMRLILLWTQTRFGYAH